MALLGKYGAHDTKSGVRVMKRALENFKIAIKLKPYAHEVYLNIGKLTWSSRCNPRRPEKYSKRTRAATA